jgi:hypothetical protein
VNNLQPVNVVALPAKYDLPEFILAVTEEESHHPAYIAFQTHIRQQKRGAQRSVSSLLASACLVALQWERVLMIRYPRRQVLLRTCKALRTLAFQAFSLCVKRGNL